MPVMATQSFVTDMQGITSGVSVQQSGVTVGQQQGGGQTKTVVTQQPGTTIIQPTQGAHGGTGQQFIVTIAGDPGTDQVQQVQEAVQQIQVSSNSQVVYHQPQYVEADSPSPTTDHASAIYQAASNGHIQGYTDYSQATMYTPVSGNYYQAQGSQMTTGMGQLAGIQGQILTHQGGTYLVQRGDAMDGDGHPLTQTTRASPATQDANGQRGAHFDVKCWQREVQWLIDNYETAEGVSLPRSTLYNHYLRHCQDQKIDPMNPASFGKLIRSVFLGLRTRRLGTRGNSKYHYYGIRIKATSTLNQYTDEQTMALRQQPVNQGKRFKSAGSGNGEDSVLGEAVNSQQQQHMQFLGSAAAAIPNLESIDLDADPLPEGITKDNLRTFEILYKEHCEAILDIVVNLQFSLVEALWQSFWRNTSPDQPQPATDIEYRLPKDKLYIVSSLESVQKFVRRSDYAFYQALVEVLIPDVLRPIPSSLTQAIRNFAKSLENWLKSSMAGVPEDMIKTKIGAVSAFAQTLRRYTSLNHLAQAARAVLQNTAQINQMLSDLNRVDFANVQEQASWVCQCDDAIVQQLEQDFKKTLQQQNSLEQWSAWLEGVVNQCLKPHDGSNNFPKAARQFLLKWSFYSSMVIRDLTLRSAASFGSFHLIRLLYDEYMFYLVEHKVAAATGETPIAVMGEFIDLGNMMSNMDNDAPKPLNSKPTEATIVNRAVSSNPLVNHTASQHSVVASLHQPTTVTVVAATGSQHANKTIVVVPVSAATQPGSGDAPQPAIKRIRTN